jgi:hypothetical protein
MCLRGSCEACGQVIEDVAQFPGWKLNKRNDARDYCSLRCLRGEGF